MTELLSRRGYTLALTETDDRSQPFYGAVLEPVFQGGDWIDLWLAGRARRSDGNPAVPDTQSAHLSPADARALAAELVAHADFLDPPKSTWDRALEGRRVVIYERTFAQAPRMGTVRLDWIDDEKHRGLYPVQLDEYNTDGVERRAYLHGDYLIPVLETPEGRHFLGNTMPPLADYRKAVT